MKIKGMPCAYYPTTVVLVDDDENLLLTLKSVVEMNSRCLTFSNEKRALEVINSNKISSFASRCQVQDEESNLDERNVKYDLKKIHHELYNAFRFDELTVIVVDYQMPKMTGIEFCQQINNGRIKKIMLTGEADNEIAIAAFNQGLIDRFIKKQAGVGLNKIMNQTIFEMQLEYFKEVSGPILDSLKNSPEKSPECLKDDSFNEFFFKFMQQHGFVEYYLLENKGNFVLLNESGKTAFFVVRNEDELSADIEYARSLYEEEPLPETKNIIEAIENKQKIPFFLTAADYGAVISEWEQYLHPLATVRCGDTNYYYAFILNRDELNSSKIQAFS